MDLKISKATVFDTAEAPWLVNGVPRFKVGGVTLDHTKISETTEANGLKHRILESGTILGKNAGTGLWEKVAVSGKASLKVGSSPHRLTVTAVDRGVQGNFISLAIVVNDQVSKTTEELTIVGNDITFNTKTDADKACNSTLAGLVAAITDTQNAAYNDEVAAIVTAALDTGATGTTKLTALAATELAGGTGIELTDICVLGKHVDAELGDVVANAMVNCDVEVKEARLPDYPIDATIKAKLSKINFV